MNTASTRVPHNAGIRADKPRTFWLVQDGQGWTWSAPAPSCIVGATRFDTPAGAYCAAMRHFEATRHRGNGVAVAQIATTQELAQVLAMALASQVRQSAHQGVAISPAARQKRANRNHAHMQSLEATSWCAAMDVAYERVMGFAFDPRSESQAALRRTALLLAEERIAACDFA